MAEQTIPIAVKLSPELLRRIDLAIYTMKGEVGPGLRITRSDILRQALELTLPRIEEPQVKVRTRTRRAA